MIFRAIFWIGVVAVLMPHQPGSGLAAATSPASVAASVAKLGLSGHDPVCEGHAAACAGGFAFVDSLQDKAVRGLAEVKADIEANRKRRDARQL